jgi:2-iminobutanoate/2-iminopropanoate deaminase
MERRTVLALASGLAITPGIRAKGATLERRSINANDISYAQAHEVTHPSRILFVGGQIPVAEDESVPKDFKSQCRLAWKNVEVQLKAAGMTLGHLAKVTVFLSDRKYRRENYEVRTEVLGKSITPALTIIITGIYDEAWLLEIEAIAVA